MRKHLLLGLAVGIGLSAAAQNRALYPTSKALTKPVRTLDQGTKLSTPTAFQNARNGNQTPSTASVTAAGGVINLGTAGNLFGMAFGAKTQLYADPNLNTVMLMHRQVNPGSGYLGYDISKSNGATGTWTTDIQVYASNGSNAAPNANARYPQGFIYNPAANTNPDNAYVTYFAPTLAGPNAGWGGVAYGSRLIATSGTPTQTEWVNDRNLIPDGGIITHNGTVFVSDGSFTATSATTSEYADSLVVFKGTFNGTDFTYTRTPIYNPLLTKIDGTKAYVGSSIAFAPNGTTGYLACIGHPAVFDPSIDSAYVPMVFKTTDGGTTWSATPTVVNIAAIQTIQDSLVGAFAYTTGFEFDMAVDMNGNPHIFCAVGAASTNWSIGTGPGNWGVFDIHSTDGGTTWNADLVKRPMTFRGCFGNCPSGPSGTFLNEDSRPQISSNWSGSKLYFVYFDTDSLTFGTTDNIFPDAWVANYDVASSSWTSPVNVSTGIANGDGEITYGTVSPYTLSVGGQDIVPIAFQRETVSGDVTQVAQFKYLNLAPVSIHEISANELFSVGQNYPNPFSGST